MKETNQPTQPTNQPTNKWLQGSNVCTQELHVWNPTELALITLLLVIEYRIQISVLIILLRSAEEWNSASGQDIM